MGDLYNSGLSTRAVGARLGVSDTTVRRMLRDEGVPLRSRGPQRHVDIEAIVTARRKDKDPWSVVAARTGASKTGVRMAYFAATGSRGAVDHHRHLTGRQMGRLQELWDRVPPSTHGAGRASLTSVEGLRFREQITAHRSAGVTLRELGRATGISYATIRAIATTEL